MKFLMLNTNCIYGNVVAVYLKEQGHIVVAYSDIKFLDWDTEIGTYRDLDKILKIIEENNFDAIINGYRIINNFAEENMELASYVNSYLPHYLEKVTMNMMTKVFQISTDCIFSGKRGCYTENDFPDGTSFYAKSKALGELNNGKDITFRNSVIGPELDPSGSSLFNWFMNQSGSIQGYTKAIWSGVTSLQLAKFIEEATIQNVHGLFNMAYVEPISKYKLLGLFNHYYRNDEVVIIPVEGVTSDKSLKRTNMDFDYEVPSYEVMLSELYDWIKQHSYLYPHYKLK